MMHVFHGLDGLQSLPRGGALSIGNFDGVHVGHAAIVRRMRQLAGDEAPLSVVTFEPHPLTVLRPRNAPPRLTPAVLKRRALQSLGVTHLLELPPTPEVLNLSAEAFWRMIESIVAPAHVVEGPNFFFGRNRGGNVEAIRAWSAGSGIGVHAIPPEQAALPDCSLVEVSSTLVRFLVGHGRVRDAAACLGRPYTLVGTVVVGNRRGRTIGVPTANLECGPQLVPTDGVYAARATTADGKTHPAAVSIGTNPTFNDAGVRVEAHLLDFDGDLYGQTLEVELLDWVREQRKYFGVEPLLRQMRRDIDLVRQLAAHPPAAGAAC